MDHVAEAGRRICRSEALRNGDHGVRFQVMVAGIRRPAFAIRFRGRAHAYLNECAHRSVELDWLEGQFFDMEGQFLICATHGARYYPDSGACAGGSCNGRGLLGIPICEENGEVWLADESMSLV